MGKRAQAVIVSYNIDNMEVCASAARISTTKGDAVEIFEKSKGNEKNRQLVQRVLQSGHRSVIEHAVFTIALKDVSAFAEQFFIENRLASFTVKSRRYVDFGGSGYYIPEDLGGEERGLYCRYMDGLFSAYSTLLENEIPKEDARFLLPYSFHSNFYCTLNARELAGVIHHIRRGRGKGIPELQDLADQIAAQVEKIFPCISFDEDTDDHEAGSSESGDNKDVKPSASAFKVDDEVSFIGRQGIGTVELLNGPADPVRILKLAYSMNHPDTGCVLGGAGEVPHQSSTEGALDLDMEGLLKSVRPRELEQLSYSFLISNVTLSGITHIVRHRMQSIIIPSIEGIAHSRVIVPETIERNPAMLKVYKDVLRASNQLLGEMCKNDKLRRYGCYCALSGNVMDVMTTMNARELEHFMRLRTCNRAQWEIRKAAVEMLKVLRGSFPELFDHFGPSCFMLGGCPEGRMTCGKLEEMNVKFKNLDCYI